MLVIRPETPKDLAAIRNVNEAAFGSSSEADLVEKLRSRQAYTLSLVAADGDKVIGHILFSPVTIESGNTNFGALGAWSDGHPARLPEKRSRLTVGSCGA